MSERTIRAVNRGAGRRRGSVLIYSLVLMTLLLGVVSLGMDYAHVQSVKTEEQRAADLCARTFLQIYLSYGGATASSTVYTPLIESYNPVDGKYAAPTFTVTPGTWDTTNHAFAATSWTGTVTAVKVTVTKSAATGNPVRLIFGAALGNKSVDVHASAVAAVVGGQSGQIDVPRNANPFLAGEPPGTTISGGWGDNTTTATPYNPTCVPVVPGTYVSFTNLTGTSSIVPGRVTATGPGGDPTLVLHHGQNYNSNPNPPYPNPENGIADAKMPADALCGLFISDAAPDQKAAPPAVDWTDAAHANQASYSNLVAQQPFLIGAGQTTGGTTQTFLVPPGVTRMFLGVWDGVCYNNNSGGLSGTVSVQQKIMIVQSQ